MKKTVSCLIFSALLLLSISGVEALITPSIDIKDVFRAGEVISFSYTVSSDISQQIRYASGINCPNIPSSLLELKTKNLIADQPFIENYTGPLVDDSIEPQSCAAYFSLIEPYEMDVNKEFMIIANPSFSFNIKICPDQSCTEESKTFVRDSNIYLDYDSEIENLTLDAVLKLPDGRTRQITLPSLAKAEQIGTYELEVTASKTGYKTMTASERFGVIEKQAEIKWASDYDTGEFWVDLFLAIIFIVVVLVVIILFKRYK